MSPRAGFTCSVQVRPLPEQSGPGQHAWAYTITIVNTGQVRAQLVARRWTIVDADGRVEQVRGLAVVGQQPLLEPGEAFEYTSWTTIATPTGSMRGSYACMTEDAQPFEAAVPEFALAHAQSLH